jgi:tetratricopeptide (TPR) repeat protein
VGGLQHLIGRRLLESGAHEPALAHLEAALEEQPSYPDLHLCRGVVLFLRGDALAAAQSARCALEGNPKLFEASLLLSLCYGEQGQDRLAQEQLQLARTHCRHGPSLQGMESRTLTIERLLDILRDSSARRIHMERADSLLQHGYWDQARELLAGLVAENPTFADLRVKLATAHLGLGDVEKARADTALALERNPSFADASLLMGTIELLEGNVLSARSRFERSRSQPPTMAHALYASAVCELQLGRVDIARAQLLTLGNLEQSLPELEILEPVLVALMGPSPSAEARFSELLDGALSTAQVLDLLCFAEHWDWERVRAKALARLPLGSSDIDVALARARALRTEGASRGAGDVLRTAVEIQPQSPALWLALGALRAEQGFESEALEDVERARELAGNRLPRPDLALAMRLARHGGAPESALRMFELCECVDVSTERECILALRCSGRGPAAMERLHRALALAPLDPFLRILQPFRWLEPLLPGRHAPRRVADPDQELRRTSPPSFPSR